MRILIVEDEHRLGDLVAKGLREEGLAADLAATRARELDPESSSASFAARRNRRSTAPAGWDYRS